MRELEEEMHKCWELLKVNQDDEELKRRWKNLNLLYHLLKAWYNDKD